MFEKPGGFYEEGKKGGGFLQAYKRGRAPKTQPDDAEGGGLEGGGSSLN